MEFIRIDENTVRCIVNEDDMREYDVEIDDFLKNRGKVQEFLHTIVERASDEIGYEPKDGLLAMQIMMLPKNRLAITFSEKMEEEGEIGQLIQQVAGAALENVSSLNDLFEEKFNQKPDVDKADDKEKKKTQKTKLATMRIFEFDNFEYFEQFVRIVPDKFNVKSSLFKEERKKTYYAILEKGRLSKVNYNYICRMATEYGTYLSDKEERKAYIEEHCTSVMNARAVKIVKKINKVESE